MERGKDTMKRPLMLNKLRKPREEVVTLISGGERPRAWKASMTAIPPAAANDGATHGSLTSSARSILRRRAHRLDDPTARQICSSQRISVSNSLASSPSKGGERSANLISTLLS